MGNKKKYIRIACRFNNDDAPLIITTTTTNFWACETIFSRLCFLNVVYFIFKNHYNLYRASIINSIVCDAPHKLIPLEWSLALVDVYIKSIWIKFYKYMREPANTPKIFSICLCYIRSLVRWKSCAYILKAQRARASEIFYGTRIVRACVFLWARHADVAPTQGHPASREKLSCLVIISALISLIPLALR